MRSKLDGTQLDGTQLDGTQQRNESGLSIDIIGTPPEATPVNRKMAYALLVLALLLVVASGATLTALYLPEHFPQAITDLVTNLSPFFHDLAFGLSVGAGVLGVVAGFGSAYQFTKSSNDKPVSNSAQSNPLHGIIDGLNGIKMLFLYQRNRNPDTDEQHTINPTIQG